MNRSAGHSKLVTDCLEELALFGFAAWKNNTGAVEVEDRFIRYGKRGSGDIFSIFPFKLGGKLYGIHAEIECKTGGATQSKRQKAHMRVVRNSGGIYIVIRSRLELVAELTRRGFTRQSSPSEAALSIQTTPTSQGSYSPADDPVR